MGVSGTRKFYFSHHFFAEVSGKDFFQGRDRLKDWYDRVVPRLQPHFQEIHTIVQKYAEKSANKVEMRLPERS